jgi:hypothetical protein
MFGPKSYGGIGHNNLRIEQGLDAIQNIMTTKNPRIRQTISYNISKNSAECVRIVTASNAVPNDKSTTSGRTLLCTYKKISCKTQRQFGDRMHTETEI